MFFKVALATLAALCVEGSSCVAKAQIPDSTYAPILASIIQSGTWNIDGEYKSSTGVFYKATGYWATVISPVEVSEGHWNAVLVLYLEPYSGGVATWMGARLTCQSVPLPVKPEALHCTAIQGASALLDINFSIQPAVYSRFEEATVTLTEPEDKAPDKRWTSRQTSRGRFRLVPL